MPITTLPIADIRALRLTCRSCGAAVVMPLDARNGPPKCFNCARPFPGPEVMRLIAELHWLQDYTSMANSEVKAEFDAAMEHTSP